MILALPSSVTPRANPSSPTPAYALAPSTVTGASCLRSTGSAPDDQPTRIRVTISLVDLIAAARSVQSHRLAPLCDLHATLTVDAEQLEALSAARVDWFTT